MFIGEVFCRKLGFILRTSTDSAQPPRQPIINLIIWQHGCVTEEGHVAEHQPFHGLAERKGGAVQAPPLWSLYLWYSYITSLAFVTQLTTG